MLNAAIAFGAQLGEKLVLPHRPGDGVGWLEQLHRLEDPRTEFKCCPVKKRRTVARELPLQRGDRA
jgi:hypothetical protein